MSAAPAAGAAETTPPQPRRPAVRIALTVAAVVVTVAVIAAVGTWTRSGPPSPSPANAWHGWTERVAPALARFTGDYVRASQDLNKSDHAAARADFERLADDARRIDSLANSIDPTVNADVRRVARHVGATAESALASWPMINLARFDAEVGAYGSASRDLTNAILAANARYGTN